MAVVRDRLANSRANVNELRCRLEQLADRLFGAVPPSPTAGEPVDTVESTCTVGQISDELGRLENTIQVLREHVIRLEAL